MGKGGDRYLAAHMFVQNRNSPIYKVICKPHEDENWKKKRAADEGTSSSPHGVAAVVHVAREGEETWMKQ